MGPVEQAIQHLPQSDQTGQGAKGRKLVEMKQTSRQMTGVQMENLVEASERRQQIGAEQTSISAIFGKKYSDVTAVRYHSSEWPINPKLFSAQPRGTTVFSFLPQDKTGYLHQLHCIVAKIRGSDPNMETLWFIQSIDSSTVYAPDHHLLTGHRNS